MVYNRLMNTLIIQKKEQDFETIMKKARQVLFELEILRSEWEIKNGLGKVYPSVKALIKDMKAKMAK